MPAASTLARRYLRTCLLLCALLYCLPFALLRTPSFERWVGSPFGPALDYGYTLQHQNADILLFGDSSAAVGLDPLQLSRALNLTVINLPNTGASLQVVGDQVLRRYLQHNRAPRLIVFYFVPWNLDYAHQPRGPIVYEGEEVLFRHGSRQDVVAYVRHHPADVFRFPLLFYSINPIAAARAVWHHRHPVQAVAASHGYADPMAHYPSLAEPCTLPPTVLSDPSHQTIEDLLRTYTTPQTRTLLYLAPIPACTNASALTSRFYPVLHAAASRTLPVVDFKSDVTYAHVRPNAVSEVTAALLKTLNSITPKLDNSRPPPFVSK